MRACLVLFSAEQPDVAVRDAVPHKIALLARVRQPPQSKRGLAPDGRLLVAEALQHHLQECLRQVLRQRRLFIRLDISLAVSPRSAQIEASPKAA